MRAYLRLLPPTAPLAMALGVERLDDGTDSGYWLRFLDGRWLIYRHERVIGDFPAENATLALAFLRQKQSERPGRA